MNISPQKQHENIDSFDHGTREERHQSNSRNPKTQTAFQTQNHKASSQNNAPPIAKPRPTISRGKLQAHASDLSNNLRSQTPLNRKLRQQTTPSEPGTSRRATKPQYYHIKTKARKQRLSIFGWRVVLVLICYAILMPISLLLVSLWLPHHTTPETRDFTYQLGDDKNVISKRIYSWSTVRTGDVYYLDMTGLASYCEMATTGDSEKMRYIVKATGEVIEFVLGQSVAYINGIPERTGGDIYLSNNRVYVPLEFVARCFTGLDVDLDTDHNKITLVRETDNDGNLLVIGFRYKLSATTAPIIFNALELEIQNQILYQNQPQPGDSDDATNTNGSNP